MDTIQNFFDPDTDEEEYCNKCDEAFDNETVGAVVVETEPSYEYSKIIINSSIVKISSTMQYIICGVTVVLCLTRRSN